MGLSRESAAYLRSHADLGYYTVNQANQVFLNPHILECDNPEVRMEAGKSNTTFPSLCSRTINGRCQNSSISKLGKIANVATTLAKVRDALG